MESHEVSLHFPAPLQGSPPPAPAGRPGENPFGERPQRARPVRNLRFTQAYAEALAPGHVIGIDGESVLTESEPTPVHTPGLALTSWAVTGGAQG